MSLTLQIQGNTHPTEALKGDPGIMEVFLLANWKDHSSKNPHPHRSQNL